MDRWLTMRNANRAAWTVLGLLGAGIAVFALFLLVQRVRPGVPGADDSPVVELDTPPLQATTGPTVRRDGTLEQVQGSAFVLRDSAGESLRVLVRGGATITLASFMRGFQSLQLGDPIIAGPLVELQNNTMAVTTITVAASAESLPTDPCTRAGRVSEVTESRLVYESRCGEQRVPITRNVRVTRLTAVGVEALQVGRRATVVAERLPDGTLAAISVQVTASQ
jgi:hypothetical protein